MSTSYGHQLDTLLERFNFNFTKSQVKQVFDTVARSKVDFKADILAVINSNQNLQNKINELGLLALQLDTRQVEVFNITDSSVKSALNLLFNTVQLTSEQLIIDAFPFSIENKTQLERLRTGTVYPVKSDTIVMGTNTYCRLVVCTVVDKEIEEAVQRSHLSQAGQQLLSSNTTFTMKRKVRTQLFHVAYWSTALSRLILSVDRNMMSIYASQDQLFILRKFLMLKGIDSGNAINVFGAIEPLYNAVDGYVTKLGHVTTDGNPVRIPLRSRQKCLKQDHYHQAGEGGGHVHAKFAVAKKWEFKNTDTNRVESIEVGLMGQPKMLDTAQPLTDFSINKSMRLEDFNFAIDRVLSLIPNP
ncbi:hypothetical protein HBM99_04710 [Providencia heimbachae]|uniref:hypothetical protein n=1 Tax=Providencia heimbachae TaxID=333962 RepID=UPI001419B328|nr:hypothetical protein [Providencia heimbachae]NIH21658.1 hypothetical protein [Providencia heimbachae]